MARRGAAQRGAAATARSESDEAIAWLQPLAVQTAAWHRLAAPLATERHTLLRLLGEALGVACDEAGTAPTLRAFVHGELARLEAGGALLGGRLSSLLRSAVRQQLRNRSPSPSRIPTLILTLTLTRTLAPTVTRCASSCASSSKPRATARRAARR